jgi:hypothetical protein
MPATYAHFRFHRDTASSHDEAVANCHRSAPQTSAAVHKLAPLFAASERSQIASVLAPAGGVDWSSKPPVTTVSIPHYGLMCEVTERRQYGLVYGEIKIGVLEFPIPPYEMCPAASQKVELIDGSRNARYGLPSTITAVTRFTLTDIAPSVIDAFSEVNCCFVQPLFSETYAFERAASE